jgi:diadenosine tetraphosphatase ApaH/serine/threonine PP2A family protein phosphatase
MLEVRRERVDQIVVGGDVLPGPMARETLALLLNLDLPVHFLYGNGERAVLAQMTASDPGAVTYWGTSGGAIPPEWVQELIRWTARQLPDYQSVLASWPKTVTLAIEGLGDVLFCHATPRSETEIFFGRTAEERLLPVFAGVKASVVVCGHVHMQFDRMVGTIRIVNAGSVGMPFGPAGADWLLLGPDVQLRHTPYDLEKAADRVRATSYPQAREFAETNILNPPSEQQMLEAFAPAELFETFPPSPAGSAARAADTCE